MQIAASWEYSRPRSHTGKRRGVGFNQIEIHRVAHHDYMAKPLGKLDLHRGHVAGVAPVRIVPALVNLGYPDQIGAKQTRDSFDFAGLVLRAAQLYTLGRHRGVIHNRGLKAFAPPLMRASVGHDIADDPGGISQRKITRTEAFAHARRSLHPVAGKERIGVFRAHRRVPKRPREYVII